MWIIKKLYEKAGHQRRLHGDGDASYESLKKNAVGRAEYRSVRRFFYLPGQSYGSGNGHTVYQGQFLWRRGYHGVPRPDRPALGDDTALKKALAFTRRKQKKRKPFSKNTAPLLKEKKRHLCGRRLQGHFPDQAV